MQNHPPIENTTDGDIRNRITNDGQCSRILNWLHWQLYATLLTLPQMVNTASEHVIIGNIDFDGRILSLIV